jgi:hypothetical protein
VMVTESLDGFKMAQPNATVNGEPGA